MITLNLPTIDFITFLLLALAVYRLSHMVTRGRPV